MKKINLFIILVCALAFGLFSCADEKLEVETAKTVDVTFEFAISDLVEMKSGALDGFDVPYCDSATTTIMAGDSVCAVYDLAFSGASGYDQVDAKWEWKVEEYGTAQLANISELRQIDFPENATSATIQFKEFKVYRNGVLKYLTPTAESAFADYVTNPLGTEYVVDLYEKQYIYTEVLCFVEEDIPLFGFAWSDFDLVFGDEICMFFNCLGLSPETYHQVLAADVEAYFMAGSEWEFYWNGQNYGEPTVDAAYSEITPFCIPAPGNWDTEGIKVVVTPFGTEETYIVWVDPVTIQAYLDATPMTAQEVYTYETTDMIGEVAVEMANQVPYVHYTFEECIKPKAYISSIIVEGGSTYSDIYALSWEGDVPSEGDIKERLVFSQDGKMHIAMTPDQSKLILVDAVTAEFFVYDIYSLEMTQLEFMTPEVDFEFFSNYYFTQLVYSDDILYAGCQTNNVLVQVDVNWSDMTYTYSKEVGREQDVQIGGGDLLSFRRPSGMVSLASFSKDLSGSFIKFFNFDGTSTGASVFKADNLEKLNGVAALDTENTALSSHNDKTKSSNMFVRYWTSGGVVFEQELGVYTTNGGDMASAFGIVPKSEFIDVFQANAEKQ